MSPRRSARSALIEGLPEISADVAVFGSGVAGLSVACALPDALRVVLFSKGPYSEGSTPYAQGGIAAAVGVDDAPALHAADTLAAAVGIADPGAVSVLTDAAPAAIDFLEEQGAVFDHEGTGLSRTVEGGHSRARIIHAGGDATGAEVSRALFAMVTKRAVPIVNDAFLVDLLTDESGRVAGALVLVEDAPHLVRFGAAVIASGGAGQLFASTTSPSTCTGDGMAVAYRAGAELCDLEFVQFHPTVLVAPGDPRPLISEALRGEGAVLRDASGSRVMAGVHPLGDLAPRDVVARTMVQLMVSQGVDRLYLDATSIASRMPTRFPTIAASLARAGIDPGRDLIPVSPASHYSIGGIWTTVDGEASLPGLYAVGEVASVGVHGANRLASNSLLEGVVFGRRIAARITAGPIGSGGRLVPPTGSGVSTALGRGPLREAMDRCAGVLRSEEGLRQLAALIPPGPADGAGAGPLDQDRIETANMACLARLVARCALGRLESRGAHFRLDRPASDPAWAVRQVIRRGGGGEPVVTTVRPEGSSSSARRS